MILWFSTKRLDEILPRLLEKQFSGTSHIESEESDKNLHWKPVLPQPFSKEKIAVSGVGESVGEQSCGDACLHLYQGSSVGRDWWTVAGTWSMVPKQRKRGRQGAGSVFSCKKGTNHHRKFEKSNKSEKERIRNKVWFGNYRKRLGDAYTFAGKTTLKTSVGSSVK